MGTQEATHATGVSEEKRLFSRREAAEYLHISPFLVDQHRRSGELQWVALSGAGSKRGRVGIERTELDAFIARRRRCSI